MIKQIILPNEFYNPFFDFAVYYAVVCITVNAQIQTFFFNYLYWIIIIKLAVCGNKYIVLSQVVLVEKIVAVIVKAHQIFLK